MAVPALQHSSSTFPLVFPNMATTFELGFEYLSFNPFDNLHETRAPTGTRNQVLAQEELLLEEKAKEENPTEDIENEKMGQCSTCLCPPEVQEHYVNVSVPVEYMDHKKFSDAGEGVSVVVPVVQDSEQTHNAPILQQKNLLGMEQLPTAPLFSNGNEDSEKSVNKDPEKSVNAVEQLPMAIAPYEEKVPENSEPKRIVPVLEERCSDIQHDTGTPLENIECSQSPFQFVISFKNFYRNKQNLRNIIKSLKKDLISLETKKVTIEVKIYNLECQLKKLDNISLKLLTACRDNDTVNNPDKNHIV